MFDYWRLYGRFLKQLWKIPGHSLENTSGTNAPAIKQSPVSPCYWQTPKPGICRISDLEWWQTDANSIIRLAFPGERWIFQGRWTCLARTDPLEWQRSLGGGVGCGDGKQRVGVWKTSLLRLLDLSEKTYSGWFYTYIAYSLAVLDYFLVDSAQIIGQCSFFIAWFSWRSLLQIPASQGDESSAATWKTDVWSAAKPPSWAVTKMARWQRDGMCFQQSDLCDYNYTTHSELRHFFEHYFMILCVWL